jgi:hypothetical protein
MATEIADDLAKATLYFSSRLNPHGVAGWAALLAEAARINNDDWLAAELVRLNLLNAMEVRHYSSGKSSSAKVPSNASEVMGEGEFNRFYMRAICLRAIAAGDRPEVYRARDSRIPRPESEGLIGQQLDPMPLLAALRASPDTNGALPNPNSGISIFLTA